MDCARGSGAAPGCNSAARSGRSREEEVAAIAGGATGVTVPVELPFSAAVAYFGIGRGIGGTADLPLRGAAERAGGREAEDCCPESGAVFFSLGTISAMLSLRT